MRFGLILDVGFRVLRRHWAILLLISLLFAGPAGLLSAATGIRLTEVAMDVVPGFGDGTIDMNTPIDESQLPRAFEALGAYVVAAMVAGVLASLGALAFSAVVVADYHARSITLRGALRACLRRAPSALAFMLITTLVIVGVVLAGLVAVLLAMSILPSSGSGGPGVFLALIVAVALVVSVVYLSMRWAPAFPVMINEDLGWRAALARAWHLSGDNVWRIFGVLLFAALLSSVISMLLSQLLSLLIVGGLAAPLGLDELVAETVTLAAVTVLVAAITPVLAAVLYFDLRARRDVPEPPPLETDLGPGR